MADMAAFAAADGAAVRVFTARPHYPVGNAFPGYDEGGHDHEQIDGVTITRVSPWLPGKRGALGRIISESAFLAKGLAALLSGRLKRGKIVITLCPSILTVLLGLFATRRGGRHVAVIHDIQSGLASGLGMVNIGIVVRMMRWLEKIVLNRTDLILVLSEAMRKQLTSQGVRTRAEILPIWVDTEFIKPLPKPKSMDAPVVLYSGNLGKKQSLDQVIEMARHLRRRNLPARVVIRGAGSQGTELSARAEYEGLDNVEFRPLVNSEDLPAALGEGDVLLVPQNDQIADFAVPSKIFAIMAAGRPFIAAAPSGSLLWKLGDKSRSHLCVPAGDAEALADAVETLINDPDLRRTLGGNGRAYAVTHHERKVVLSRFMDLVNEDRKRSGAEVSGGHYLVFEPDARGHAAEWVKHLIAHVRKNPVPARITFTLPRALEKEIGGDLPRSVRLDFLDDSETARCTHPQLIVSAFARWWAMRRALERSHATHGLFLGIDHASFPLALGLPAGGRTVSGIMFRPTTHYRTAGWCRPTMKERLRDLRKDIILRLLTRRRAVSRIFSLDPYFPDYAARSYKHGHKVVPLADPAYPLAPPGPEERAIAERLPDERTVFLMFGEITARKGILQLTEALTLLPRDTARRTCVVVAGRIDPEIRVRVTKAFGTILRRQPDLKVFVVDRRLAAGEITALVERCDVVLAPYQRFVGSSGVLLWAAQLRRPVISQEYGLVGKLTRNFGLGLAVDTSDAGALAHAIEAAGSRGSNLPFNPVGVARFLWSHSPEAFSAALLSDDGMSPREDSNLVTMIAV
ncbi:MAG: hypothetical protein COW30_12765 [Rhodospirillales bacterium CG15_BIG_FIL_POST_REV_8_21_14_020_66_15]|nr:MAG: hypothetical protein COW30_12765 [Rhodospirillales bacterium CG15_BIG_FIL_POST_REV_8_21_14_020_66_15]